MDTLTDAEAIISAYLAVLHGNVDEGLLAAMRKQYETETDVLEKLRVRQAIIDLTDPSSFETGFILHAKNFCKDNGLTVDAFEAEGVPADVLKAAGMLGDVTQERARHKAKQQRKYKPISQGQLRAAMHELESFTVAALQSHLGSAPGTTRAAVLAAEKDGVVARIGKDPDHVLGIGQGRAPYLYRWVVK